ncbi:hypothetical protein DICPUDRAFT_77285 [Dictyostelium purpureum]|uniref:Uncharacterized protein n=1 Tax=Dictyostelium purpureum TaxID=5786 RepID=F0ZG60_DICPU|nr:uncharacterized protein DICPUDRAFT_77285 [Dictyostelium purpureum]EGC37045.1 hypothetical protein DICPUDRAFT_77285 [Dictyostelium purpureum]|eukprot:XP_003286402.1 hypothetical protein DICPUDRAFT_77285 [Dictyostelium purpureum]
MDFLNFGSFFFVVVICILLGFLYKCLKQIDDLKQQEQQQQANKNLDNDYSLTILKLKNELSRLEAEKRIHNDHQKILSEKQEVIDQKNQYEFEKLRNVKNAQFQEISQYQNILNQQRKLSQDNDIEQCKLVEEKNSLKAKLENQFSKSYQLQEELLEKDEIIQLLEKKLLSEQIAVVQLSCEHKQTLEKLNLRS